MSTKEGVTDAAEGPSLTSETVTQKFAAAATIAHDVLQHLMSKCVPGARVTELCIEGDNLIKEKVQKIYNKKQADGEKMSKGIAFPTCISLNHIMAYFSPITDDTSDVDEEYKQLYEIKQGDLVKIVLGAQFDGYPAVVGHTFVVGEASSRQSDVILAAWTAAQAALRTMKTTNTNYHVTEAMEQSYNAYDCKGVQGVLHHEIRRNAYDYPPHSIQNKMSSEDKIETFEFKEGTVFVIDAMASTGSGKPKETKLATTIYKRDVDNSHVMKTPLTRQFMADLLKYRPYWPYNSREESDSKRRALGTAECLRNFVLQAYPVLMDSQGEFVANFVFTVMILDGGRKKFTGLPLDTNKFTNTHQIPDSLKSLLDEEWEFVWKKKSKTDGQDDVKKA